MQSTGDVSFYSSSKDPYALNARGAARQTEERLRALAYKQINEAIQAGNFETRVVITETIVNELREKGFKVDGTYEHQARVNWRL